VLEIFRPEMWPQTCRAFARSRRTPITTSRSTAP
jgi:hypothetical protein